MRGSRLALNAIVLAVAGLGCIGFAQAETVIQQCGQQYQAAKAAGTLNGMTWNQFRSDCSAKLKAQPAAASAPAAATPAATATAPANPLNPTPAVAPAAPAPASTATTASSGTKPTVSAGRAAFVVRERECGTEWRANKVSLVAQTPGLTWPKYLSQCNARLKALGQ